MCFLGITFQYTVKVSVSISIVAMVCKAPINVTEFRDIEGNLPVEELDVCPGTYEEETGSEVLSLSC
jgi:hypothetical protein